VFGNIFAFVAGLLTAGLVSYVYPQTRRAQVGTRRGDSQALRSQGQRDDESGLLDLNDATEEELQELNGIGPALAGRITENRPYRNKLELVSRMVIPEAAYERIKDHVTVSEESAEEPIQVAL
jgi:DNA uptake protein ComE-like DNA-binding protein